MFDWDVPGDRVFAGQEMEGQLGLKRGTLEGPAVNWLARCTLMLLCLAMSVICCCGCGLMICTSPPRIAWNCVFVSGMKRNTWIFSVFGRRARYHQPTK